MSITNDPIASIVHGEVLSDGITDPIQHAVSSLPPFMQRRMAKLALAGVRFVLEADDIYAWKVSDRRGVVIRRYMYLERAINETWREWLMAQNTKDASAEDWEDGNFRNGVLL